MTDHTAPELKRLHEFLDNQLADPNTAPAVVFLDPDLPPSEWEKQYHMDVVYIRADLHRAEVAAKDAEIAKLRGAEVALIVNLAMAKEALEGWLNVYTHCSIEEGVCCCGDDMKNHTLPMDTNHMPLDHGAYVAGRLAAHTTTIIEELTGEKGK